MKLLDVVATLQDIPAAHLSKGQVGTIVDALNDEIVLVEFADLDGTAYAIEPIPVFHLIKLHHAPTIAAWKLFDIQPNMSKPPDHGN